MTAPVTGRTPVYGLEYLIEGEPAKFTRQKLERNAKTIEAALIRGGIAPPEAQDLATLAGRVTALEPGTWVIPATQGRANLGTGYTPLRYRKVPALGGVRVTGMVVAGAAGTLFTLQPGFRPPRYGMLHALLAGGGGADCQVGPDGVVAVPATSGWMSFDGIVELD